MVLPASWDSAVLELGDLRVACLDAFAEPDVLVFQPGDVEFAWIRDGARLPESGQPALELRLEWTPRASLSTPSR